MLRRTLLSTSRALDRACLIGTVSFFAAVLGLIVFQVLARYVFRSVPTWTAESARYCMVWSGLLGAASAFKAGRDPRILNPPDRGQGGWWPAAAAALRGVAVLVFLGPVLFHSRQFLARHWDRTTEAMGISTAWVTAAVPVAILLIFVHLFARIAESTAPGRKISTIETGEKT